MNEPTEPSERDLSVINSIERQVIAKVMDDLAHNRCENIKKLTKHQVLAQVISHACLTGDAGGAGEADAWLRVSGLLKTMVDPRTVACVLLAAFRAMPQDEADKLLEATIPGLAGHPIMEINPQVSREWAERATARELKCMVVACVDAMHPKDRERFKGWVGEA